jgi:hypothetical protein
LGKLVNILQLGRKEKLGVTVAPHRSFNSADTSRAAKTLREKRKPHEIHVFFIQKAERIRPQGNIIPACETEAAKDGF